MPRPRRLSPTNYQVRALQRGLRVLCAFIGSTPRLNLADISARLELPKPTTLRLLECLRDQGFLSWEAESGLYSLGIRAFEVGSAYLAVLSLEQVATSSLRRLSARTNQTANLGVLDRSEVVHLVVVEPERPLQYHTRVGAREYVHCTALGKVLLSSLEPAEADVFIRSTALPARTSATITDPTVLRQEITRARQRGYAEDREEAVPGLRCLGAPILDASNAVIAAIGISGPAADFTGSKRGNLLAALLQTARELSERLGGTIPACPQNPHAVGGQT